MQFLILFPFPSPASVPRRFIRTMELCFPSLPFPGTGAASLLHRCGGDPPCHSLPGAPGLDVHLAGAGAMRLARVRDGVSLSRLSAHTIAGIAGSV